MKLVSEGPSFACQRGSLLYSSTCLTLTFRPDYALSKSRIMRDAILEIILMQKQEIQVLHEHLAKVTDFLLQMIL